MGALSKNIVPVSSLFTAVPSRAQGLSLYPWPAPTGFGIISFLKLESCGSSKRKFGPDESVLDSKFPSSPNTGIISTPDPVPMIPISEERYIWPPFTT